MCSLSYISDFFANTHNFITFILTVTWINYLN